MRRKRIIFVCVLVGIILAPVVILAASYLYRTAIGYYKYEEGVQIFVLPKGTFPLEYRTLPDIQPGEVTRIGGITLPRDWRPKLRFPGGSVIDCSLPRRGALIVIASADVAELVMELERLTKPVWGSYGAFRGQFRDDDAMFEAILSRTVPQEMVDAPFSPLPLFPERRNYRLEAVYLVVKTCITWGPQTKYTGKVHYFYVLERHPRGADILIGNLADGRAVGSVYLGHEDKLDDETIARACAAIDAGAFAPLVATQPAASAPTAPR